jgi:hypothetical protein
METRIQNRRLSAGKVKKHYIRLKPTFIHELLRPLVSGTTALCQPTECQLAECQPTECQFYNILPNANRPNAN